MASPQQLLSATTTSTNLNSDDIPPWMPLAIRLKNLTEYIARYGTPGSKLVSWEKDSYLQLAKMLVHRATTACNQGAFLALKMEDIQRRLSQAEEKDQHGYYQPLWNELTTYQGVANMYGQYFADIACSAEDVLTMLETQIFALRHTQV